MRNDINTTGFNKFCHFYYEHNHDIEEYHALKKKIKILISRRYLQQIINKEIQLEKRGKNLYDVVSEIR